MGPRRGCCRFKKPFGLHARTLPVQPKKNEVPPPLGNKTPCRLGIGTTRLPPPPTGYFFGAHCLTHLMQLLYLCPSTFSANRLFNELTPPEMGGFAFTFSRNPFATSKRLLGGSGSDCHSIHYQRAC